MPQKGPKNARKRSADKKEEYPGADKRIALLLAGPLRPQPPHLVPIHGPARTPKFLVKRRIVRSR